LRTAQTGAEQWNAREAHQVTTVTHIIVIFNNSRVFGTEFADDPGTRSLNALVAA
jgi:hypothetical protein